MNVILVIIVFTVLELFLSRRRSREIQEALGTRDYLIETLRSEMKDKLSNIHTFAVGEVVSEEDTFTEMMNDLAQTLEIIDKRQGLAREQSTSNRKFCMSLRRDVNHLLVQLAKIPEDRRVKPPLGEKPTFPRLSVSPSPDVQPKPHCYDGPTNDPSL